MITIKDQSEMCLIVKKSRFLGLACRADSAEQAQQIIDARRKQHRDARHHCFAWLLEDQSMRCSDDGEPQGTAGLPILEAIKKTGLSNVLVIVTRYFGGTLLGTGGLCRAYTQCAVQALETANKVRLCSLSMFACTFDFPTFSRIRSVLTGAGYTMEEVHYGSDVRIQFGVSSGNEKTFLAHISNLTLGKTVPVPLASKRVTVDL